MTFSLEVILGIFMVGIVLLGVEVFVVGFGIAGVLGIGAIITSLVMAGATVGQLGVSLALAGAIVAGIGFWAYRRIKNNRSLLYKGLILTDSTSKEQGYLSHNERKELLGKEGITQTPLRPAGVVEVNGERLDVVTEGIYVNENIRVVIVNVDSGRIVVKPVSQSSEEMET